MGRRFAATRLIERWLAVTLSLSLVSLVGAGGLADWTALSPDRVLRGEVWRLVTWVFVESSPRSLIFLCVTIYALGGDLALRWGDRRLRRFLIELLAGATAFTMLVALLAPGTLYLSHSAGWVIGDVLCIAWARQFPAARLRLYGMLEVGGARLVAVTVGVTVIFALAFGPTAMAPELFACAAAIAYPERRLARR